MEARGGAANRIWGRDRVYMGDFQARVRAAGKAAGGRKYMQLQGQDNFEGALLSTLMAERFLHIQFLTPNCTLPFSMQKRLTHNAALTIERSNTHPCSSCLIIALLTLP